MIQKIQNLYEMFARAASSLESPFLLARSLITSPPSEFRRPH
jgi:hypothetical protein